MKRTLHRVTVRFSQSDESTRHGEINGIPYVEKLARIFKAGTHRGRPYTINDLDRLVSNFRRPATEIDWTVPAYRDHPPHREGNASVDNLVGNVRELFRRRNELWGWIRFIGSEVVEKVQSGLFRKLSAGIYYDGMELDEVSLVPDPYFDDTQIFSKQTKEDTTVPDIDEKKEEAGKGAPPAKREKRETEDFAAINDRWEQRMSALMSELETLKAQNAQQAKEVEVFRADRLRNTAYTRVEVFRAAGKTTKAMADPEKAFVATLSDEQFSLYEKVKEAQPELFRLGFQGDVGAEPGVPVDRPGGEDENTKTRVSKLTQKYGKALRKAMKEEE